LRDVSLLSDRRVERTTTLDSGTAGRFDLLGEAPGVSVALDPQAQRDRERVGRGRMRRRLAAPQRSRSIFFERLAIQRDNAFRRWPPSIRRSSANWL
jgi:hypothetical protein